MQLLLAAVTGMAGLPCSGAAFASRLGGTTGGRPARPLGSGGGCGERFGSCDLVAEACFGCDDAQAFARIRAVVRRRVQREAARPPRAVLPRANVGRQVRSKPGSFPSRERELRREGRDLPVDGELRCRSKHWRAAPAPARDDEGAANPRP